MESLSFRCFYAITRPFYYRVLIPSSIFAIDAYSNIFLEKNSRLQIEITITIELLAVREFKWRQELN